MSRPRIKQYWIGALLSVAAILLAACGAEEATPTPTTAPATPTPTTAATPTPTAMVATTPTPTTAVVGEQPKYGGILNLWARREPTSYDPPVYGGIDWQPRFGPVVEGLISLDRENQSIPQPALAESWDVSEDGKTYTFHLRQGVQWHDGVPFTAEDVVYGYNRFFNPPAYTISPRRTGLASFKEVRATDDHTVVFEFGATEVEVIAFFGFPRNRVLSKHQLEPIDQAEGSVPPEIIGTGPFKVKTFRRESLLELERNTDYWAEGLPYLDGIRLASGRDVATMLAAFRTRRIDMTARGSGMYMTPSQANIIAEARPDVTIYTRTAGVPATLWPNNQEEPWTDVRVRHAVDIGIDRQFICQVGKEGACTMAIGVPTGAFGSIPEEELLAMPGYRQPKDQDLTEAKRLLAEAGYANGFKTEIIVRDSQIWAAEPLAFELEKLGIEATLSIRDTISHEDLMVRGEYNSQLGPGLMARTPGFVTAELASDMKSDSGRNRGKIQDAKLDEFLERQATTVDLAERQEVLRDMFRYVLDQSFAMVLALPQAPIAVSGDVKNFIAPLEQMFNNEHTVTWLER